MEPKSTTLSRLRSNGVAEDYLQCPTCECKLQHWEVKKHFEQEMERLRQLQMKVVNEATTELSQQSVSNVGNSEERRKPWTVFQRVQRNRHSRLKRKNVKRPLPPPTEQQCPICNTSFRQDEIQQHVDMCLHRSNDINNGRDDGSSSNDDEDGEEYEEYEWAGQKRIRVSSLLEGGYAAIGIGQTIVNHNGSVSQNVMNAAGEEEEDLNVDEDDTQIYGPAQYGEADVIPSTTEENGNSADSDLTNYMRRLITGADTFGVNSNTVETRSSNDTNAAVDSETYSVLRTESSSCAAARMAHAYTKATFSNSTNENYPQIVESLKTKLRQYETQVQNKFKCLICLDDYRNPAISVACWHVHCEECWLRSLGARKLCPQCNLITTPKDLRRIYM